MPDTLQGTLYSEGVVSHHPQESLTDTQQHLKPGSTTASAPSTDCAKGLRGALPTSKSPFSVCSHVPTAPETPGKAGRCQLQMPLELVPAEGCSGHGCWGGDKACSGSQAEADNPKSGRDAISVSCGCLGSASPWPSSHGSQVFPGLEKHSQISRGNSVMKLTTLDENQQLNWPIHLWPTTVCWCLLCRGVSVCFPVRWGSLQDDVRPPIHMPAPLFSKSRVSVKSAQMRNHTNAGRAHCPRPSSSRYMPGGRRGFRCTPHAGQGRAISAFPSSSSFPTPLLQASDAISRDGALQHAACPQLFTCTAQGTQLQPEAQDKGLFHPPYFL